MHNLFNRADGFPMPVRTDSHRHRKTRFQ